MTGVSPSTASLSAGFSTPWNLSSLWCPIYGPRHLSVISRAWRTTTSPVAQSSSHSVSCAHTRWKSRASGTSLPVDFTYSGERRPSCFWGVSASDMTFVLSVLGAGVVIRLSPPSGIRSARLPYGTAPSRTTVSTRHHVSFGCFQLCCRVFSSSSS
jgi:hypothetical protein